MWLSATLDLVPSYEIRGGVQDVEMFQLRVPFQPIRFILNSLTDGCIISTRSLSSSLQAIAALVPLHETSETFTNHERNLSSIAELRKITTS